MYTHVYSERVYTNVHVQLHCTLKSVKFAAKPLVFEYSKSVRFKVTWAGLNPCLPDITITPSNEYAFPKVHVHVSTDTDIQIYMYYKQSVSYMQPKKPVYEQWTSGIDGYFLSQIRLNVHVHWWEFST